jgi:hypothetical protein
MIIISSASTVRDALACARRVANLKLADSREVTRSGGEDGCYRCHLADGTIVEVTLISHSKATATMVED